MPRAIDFHVHLPTTEFMQVTLGPYAQAAERYFRTQVKLKDIEQIAADYADLGLAGAKFHPGVQAFYPNDPTFYPLMEKIQELGVPALFHTGTNGLGAGTPGGMGIKLDYTRPIYLDSLAADFPGLTIIGAHPSWPWHEEMLATMQHKTNVYNDLSGWVPRRIPESLMREAATRLQDKILFGSDYPFITPQRWLKDFEPFTQPDAPIFFKPEVQEKLMWGNAQKLLAHTVVGQMSFSL